MQYILIKRNKEAQRYPLSHPQKPGDIGYDLYTTEEMTIPSNNPLPVDVPTGVCIKLPEGYWGLVINRSSAPRKMGLEVVTGVIDNGYTGELFACCFNRTGKDIKVEKGQRIAQFIVMPMNVFPLSEVDELPETERGDAGFGSTGT